MWSVLSSTTLPRLATLAVAATLLAAPLDRSAVADSGPFAALPGDWSGTGKIRVQGQNAERLRCKATYRSTGSTQHDVNLRLACDSDSYKFDLTGDFTADASNNISGRWTESSRNVGGTAIGTVQGDRFQIHIESSAFAANMELVTRGTRQAVTFDAHGGGQVVDSSITLNRGAR